MTNVTWLWVLAVGVCASSSPPTEPFDSQIGCRGRHCRHHPHDHPPSIPTRDPTITIIQEGSIWSQPNGNGTDYDFVATVALIEENGKRFIFDTATATDHLSYRRMLSKLKELRIRPRDIDYVILSHAHLDHTGHASMFKNARIYYGSHMFFGSSLTYIGTYEFGGHQITKNVGIVPTPGHTASCISALVTNAHENAKYVGSLAITGDLFFKKDDLTDASIWQGSATNVAQQAESRKKILCQADSIIPGHGPQFYVPLSEKDNCDDFFSF